MTETENFQLSAIFSIKTNVLQFLLNIFQFLVLHQTGLFFKHSLTDRIKSVLSIVVYLKPVAAPWLLVSNQTKLWLQK